VTVDLGNGGTPSGARLWGVSIQVEFEERSNEARKRDYQERNAEDKEPSFRCSGKTRLRRKGRGREKGRKERRTKTVQFHDFGGEGFKKSLVV
jgi:hypothetical protein